MDRDDREGATPEPVPARRGADAEPNANDVEEASRESFPASDPPAWEPLHPGAPGEHPEPPKR